MFGIGPLETSLELLREHVDGSLTHYRYGQRYAGYRVLDGQLTVHVSQAQGGYVVQSANGWLFPDVAVPVLPVYSRRDAESAALVGLALASLMAAEDTAPVVVAHNGGYQLAYLVPVVDSGRAEIRYVDAVSGAIFAETEATMSFAAGEGRAVPRSTDTDLFAHSWGPNGSRSLDGFVTVQGRDWQLNLQTFKAWQAGSNYQLRDNSHAGASEIRIHNYNGAAISGNPCDNEYVVQRGLVGGLWPQDTIGKEEVSGSHNLGESVSYWKNTFARNGMWNDNATLKACVHGSANSFDARYFPTNRTLGFRQETGNDGPSVAGQDVATHEFTHGVSHAEVAFSSGFEYDAVKEALSDYFGARHRGSSCMAGGVWGGGACFRQINSSLTLGQRLAGPPGACWVGDTLKVSCVGIVVSSALWATSQTPGLYYAFETDWSVYQAMLYYMTPLTGWNEAREAVVRRAKDRVHTPPGWGNGLDLSPTLETQFFNRGVGYPPVGVQMSVLSCDQWASQWRLDVTGAASYWRSFSVTFEIGSSGLNADGSVSFPDDSIPLGDFTATSEPFSRTFTEDETNYHSGTDGHYHGFRVRFNDGGLGLWLDYYAGDAPGCGPNPSVVAYPSTTGGLPTRFAVRQAVATPAGVMSAQAFGAAAATPTGGTQPSSLGEHVRQHGLTALEVDVPAGSAPAPLAASWSAGTRLDVGALELAAALLDVAWANPASAAAAQRVLALGAAARRTIVSELEVRLEVDVRARDAEPRTLDYGLAPLARWGPIEVALGYANPGGWSGGASLSHGRWRVGAGTNFIEAGRLDQRMALSVTYQ